MLPTSEIKLESSLHGKKRRDERDIAKRDLQAAIKYGEKELGFPCPRTGRPRWKYTHADIVYITDETSSQEVTSWALELPLVHKEIPENYLTRNQEAKKRVYDDPHIITSHTVLIVDMSGSMRTPDVEGHRSRERGVYYNLSEQFIASSLPPLQESGVYSGGCKRSFTDVVTLIEMRDFPTIVFEREPISWVLYNTFVDLAEAKGARSHGNYFPCFQDAFRVLHIHLYHQHCALNLFFFSDGKPSDNTTESKVGDFPYNLYSLIMRECRKYPNRLNFFAIGYGESKDEFMIMKKMVKYAQNSGANATFASSYKDDTLLSSVLSTLSTSLTQTRLSLSRLNLGNYDAEISSEQIREKVDTTKHSLEEQDKFSFTPGNYRIFNNSLSNSSTLPFKGRMELRLEGGRWQWEELSLQHPQAVGVAVSKAFFAEGAERIVFLMTEIDQQNNPIGPHMVAKESLYKHCQQELKFLRYWHQSFIKTQMRARELAGDFNQRLDRMGVSRAIPRIEFLPCCVYECCDIYERKDYTFLAEPRLDPKLYMKWNNNAGGVDGIVRINPDAEKFLAQEEAGDKEEGLRVIEEEEEDEEEEEREGADNMIAKHKAL